jgi:hypothetical protein
MLATYPAREVEDFLRRQLGDQKTRDELALGEARIAAKPMAALWQSLEVPSQMRILAQVVERIEFGSKNTVLRITFNERLHKALYSLSTWT